MNNLSEEKIIIECNKLLITLKNSHIDGKIIQILYDLYEQEKKKNKELKVLIEQNLRYSHNLEKDLFENCSNYVVSKDKIRKKISVLEKIQSEFTNNEELRIKIITLKDLLLEEE